MPKKPAECALCAGTEGCSNLHGYLVCEPCKSKLGLLKDETIQRHVASFDKARKKSSKKPAYEEEIRNRLGFLEKDYVRKRIKLLHVVERLKRME